MNNKSGLPIGEEIENPEFTFLFTVNLEGRIDISGDIKKRIKKTDLLFLKRKTERNSILKREDYYKEKQPVLADIFSNCNKCENNMCKSGVAPFKHVALEEEEIGHFLSRIFINKSILGCWEFDINHDLSVFEKFIFSYDRYTSEGGKVTYQANTSGEDNGGFPTKKLKEIIKSNILFGEKESNRFPFEELLRLICTTSVRIKLFATGAVSILVKLAVPPSDQNYINIKLTPNTIIKLTKYPNLCVRDDNFVINNNEKDDKPVDNSDSQRVSGFLNIYAYEIASHAFSEFFRCLSVEENKYKTSLLQILRTYEGPYKDSNLITKRFIRGRYTKKNVHVDTDAHPDKPNFIYKFKYLRKHHKLCNISRQFSYNHVSHSIHLNINDVKKKTNNTPICKRILRFILLRTSRFFRRFLPFRIFRYLRVLIRKLYKSLKPAPYIHSAHRLTYSGDPNVNDFCLLFELYKNNEQVLIKLIKLYCKISLKEDFNPESIPLPSKYMKNSQKLISNEEANNIAGEWWNSPLYVSPYIFIKINEYPKNYIEDDDALSQKAISTFVAMATQTETFIKNLNMPDDKEKYLTNHSISRGKKDAIFIEQRASVAAGNRKEDTDKERSLDTPYNNIIFCLESIFATQSSVSNFNKELEESVSWRITNMLREVPQNKYNLIFSIFGYKKHSLFYLSGIMLTLFIVCYILKLEYSTWMHCGVIGITVVHLCYLASEYYTIKQLRDLINKARTLSPCEDFSANIEPSLKSESAIKASKIARSFGLDMLIKNVQDRLESYGHFLKTLHEALTAHTTWFLTVLLLYVTCAGSGFLLDDNKKIAKDEKTPKESSKSVTEKKNIPGVPEKTHELYKKILEHNNKEGK